MASKIKNIAGLFGDMKIRTIIIFTAVILFIGVGIAVTRINDPGAGGTPASRTAGAPRDIQNIPGVRETSEQYRKLQEQRNVEAVEQARKKGTSAIPTLTGTFEKLPTPEELEAKRKAEAAAAARAQRGTTTRGRVTLNRLLTMSPAELRALTPEQLSALGITPEQLAMLIQRAEDRAKGIAGSSPGEVMIDLDVGLSNMTPEQLAALRARRAKVYELAELDLVKVQSGLQRAMTGQGRALINSWTKVPTQVLVEGKNTGGNAGGSGNGNGSGSGTGRNGVPTPGGSNGLGSLVEAKPPLAKAGDIVFAILDTDVDSDDQGVVLATIIEGEMRGGKLIGKTKLTSNEQRLSLTFNQLSLPSANKSMAVNATAVNPFTGRPALATSVNNHYVKRYGALFLSNILKGYGKAIQDQGTVVEDTPAGGRRETTPERNRSEELLIALGEVGNALADDISEGQDVKPTVKIRSGVSVGIMFLADVKDSR